MKWEQCIYQEKQKYPRQKAWAHQHIEWLRQPYKRVIMIIPEQSARFDRNSKTDFISLDQPALVLIADDDSVTRILLRSSLAAEGYRVVEAANGEQCLDAYRHFQPDLVLLDALMPVMDGFTCCQNILQLPGSEAIPILMITGLEDTKSIDRAFAAGATDYINKPIHWALFRQRVRRLLHAGQAVAALQRQTERERCQAERERLISTISQRIRQSLDVETILDTAVTEVRQLLQVDRVLVYRFDPNWSGVVEVESTSSHCQSLLGIAVEDQCFVQHYLRPYQQGRVRSIADIYAENLAPCHLEFLERLQVKANLVVPILQGTHLWGLLIAHHCTAPRHWQQWEIELVDRLATQLAIAIQQADLYGQVQQLNANLERQVQERTAELRQALKFEATLKRITDKVRDSLDESQILQTAAHELALALEVEGCNASLHDFTYFTQQVLYESAINDVADQDSLTEAAKFPELYSQLLRGQHLQFCVLMPQLHPSNRSLLVCPIFIDQALTPDLQPEILGDLWLTRPMHRNFTEPEIRLVQQVTNQCAIAIRQARLYQTAQAQVAELERLNQMKDDFLSTVSHELRSPVANMRLAIQMLEQTLNHLSPLLSQAPTHLQASFSKGGSYLQILHHECEREISLINDLLDLQRLEAGYQQLRLDTIDLPHWISDVATPFIERAQSRQQTLQICLAPNLPILFSDPVGIKRVLAELLNNACKYTPPAEKITLSVAITYSNILELKVSNTGVEIPDQEMSHIFEKFYRIPSSDRWKQGGTGLGLALAKRLVEFLGGSIQVSSSSEQTCFTVCLPLHYPQ